MRILAIRGQNLASLAESFEIDLTQPPLSGTGLFAITGDTGAGKSTILDALCLGLYGAYPRAASEGRERVFDPGNEEIQAGDARNILRRGAGEGFAEVEFVGQDGIGYRARWTVRRARSRANGRLQSAERRLDRLDGSANVASGIRDVDAAVIEKTGLTYDQFRRTVLLAQGEFDTFLLATETDRADLLEKITGTDIYSRISKRVHAEKDARERCLREREAASQTIETLSPEQRRALAAELDEKGKAAEALEVTIRSLAAKRTRADLVARTRESLAAAEAALSAAEDRWRAAEGKREQLAALQKVEPLRAKVEAQSRARDRLADAEKRLRSAQAEEHEASASHADLEAVEKRAKENAAAARNEVARFSPMWEEASKLDALIAQATQEFEAAETDHANARDEAAKQQATHDQRRKARDELLGRRAQTEKDLAARAAHAPLHANRARIKDLVADHDRLSRDLAACIRDQETSARDIGALEARREASVDEVAKVDARIAELEAVSAEKGAALAAMGLEEAEARDEPLGFLERALNDAREAAAKRDAALDDRDSATAIREAALRARAEAEQQLSANRNAENEAKLKRKAIAQLVDLAEATASRPAEALRADLVPGEPCPVCGASSHPYSGRGEKAQALVATIRQQRDDLDAAVEAARCTIAAAEGKRATANADISSAETAITAAMRRFDEAVTSLSRLLHEINGLAGSSRISVDSIAGGAAADVPVAACAGAHEEVVAARGVIQALRKDASTLRRERDDLNARIKDLRDKARDAQASMRDGEAALSELRALGAGLKERRQLLEGQLEIARGALVPFLSAAMITAEDLAKDGKGVHARIERLVETYDGLLASRDRLAGDIEAAESTLRDAATALQRAMSEAARCAEHAAKRRAQVADLEEQRARLLDGKPTGEHRAGFEAAVKEAEEALRLAAGKLHDAAIEKARTAEAAKSAVKIFDESKRDAADADGEVDATLARLDLEDAIARSLLSVSPETCAAIADEVAALEKERSDAQAAVATWNTSLAELGTTQAEGSPEEIAALSQEHSRLGEEKEELTRAIAIINDTLKRDHETRERLADALKKIEALKADFEVWRDVHDAIGASDGAKFKRFAQGITLRQLVGLANRQLAALNPRYQLRQSAASALALEVIDRDMGEEVRAPRSLSGGERFLVSLALALALSGLEGRQSFVDTLFIDEGFGSLDRGTLDEAIDALEALQGQGRKVGLITHVQAMIERIAVQIRVEKRGGGRSVVRMRDSATGEGIGRMTSIRSAEGTSP
jgi:exonuclease SbcC